MRVKQIEEIPLLQQSYFKEPLVEIIAYIYIVLKTPFVVEKIKYNFDFG